MSKRTDCHRPGAIIPADYRYVLSYALPTTRDGARVPAIGINCEIDRRKLDEKGILIANGEHNVNHRCCIVALKATGVRWARHGSPGKCDVCGAAFSYGDVWEHTPTGELVMFGHDCADKYALLADRADFDARLDMERRRTAAEITRQLRVEARAKLFHEHPDLDAAFAINHPIIRDIVGRFTQYGQISPAQIELVRKIALGINTPKPEEPKATMPWEAGRQLVEATVLGVKWQENDYGGTWKVLLRDGAHRKLWMTLPSLTHHDGSYYVPEELKGATIACTVSVEPSRDDPGFGFGKRPTKAAVTALPPAEPVAAGR